MLTTLLIFTTEWLIYIVIAGVLLAGLVLWGFKTSIKLGLTILVADIIAYTLKYIFNTPRPAEALAYFIYDPAFPSGHTAVLAALGVAVFFKHRLFGFVILGLALVVGSARVLSGIHFPIDIAGGFVIGGAIGLVFSKWLKV